MSMMTLNVCKRCNSLFYYDKCEMFPGNGYDCNKRSCYYLLDLSEFRINRTWANLSPENYKEKLKVFINEYTINKNGCWIWTNSMGKEYNSYPSLIIKGVKEKSLSRLSYLVHKGEIPKGLLICHKCDNPPCINPDHLFLGSYKDNSQDMVNKKRYRKSNQYYRQQEVKEKIKLYCNKYLPDMESNISQPGKNFKI